MASHKPGNEEIPEDEEEQVMMDGNEVEEEVQDDDDVAMDSDGEEDDEEDDEDQVIALQNDSSAHFDGHKDSIFCIAQHPAITDIVATGGGDDTAYIWDSTPAPSPVLPSSYETTPQAVERRSIEPLAKLEGHTDSVNAIAFTLPKGEYVATAGLDGQLRVWRNARGDGQSWKLVASAQEVQEINWLAPCPDPAHSNAVAFGANDGSVWVYEIDASNTASPLSIVQAFYLHTTACTAGVWTPDGKLLATVSEDESLYVWDVWGEAAAAGFTSQGVQHVVGLTGEDERFRVEGGLYSVAISPGGALCAVGGAGGMVRVVSLPRFGADSAVAGAKGAGAKGKAGGAKLAGGKSATGSASAGQAGQVLASLQSQAESVETIAFADPPLTLMAAGSVDGTIVLFDAAHRFAVRRKIEEAHEEEAVIRVEFVKAGKGGTNGWVLTSCGNDGVVRRWDCRGGTSQGNRGLIREWRGHRGGGEGGGVLGFVQKAGDRIITAGDDSVALVFNAPLA